MTAKKVSTVELLTKAQVCAMLKTTAVTLAVWIKDKGLPVHSGGGKKGVPMYFSKVAVEAWQKSQQDENGSEDSSDEMKALKLEQERYKLRIMKEKLKGAVTANQIIAGDVYPADVVDNLWAERMTTFAKDLLYIAPGLAFELERCQNREERQEVIDKKLRGVLSALAKKVVYDFDKKPWLEEIKKAEDDGINTK